jgi:hypothetical protein
VWGNVFEEHKFYASGPEEMVTSLFPWCFYVMLVTSGPSGKNYQWVHGWQATVSFVTS